MLVWQHTSGWSHHLESNLLNKVLWGYQVWAHLDQGWKIIQVPCLCPITDIGALISFPHFEAWVYSMAWTFAMLAGTQTWVQRAVTWCHPQYVQAPPMRRACCGQVWTMGCTEWRVLKWVVGVGWEISISTQTLMLGVFYYYSFFLCSLNILSFTLFYLFWVFLFSYFFNLSVTPPLKV
jgi:hypothetical protein